MNVDNVTNTALTHEKMMMNVGGLIFSCGREIQCHYLRTTEKGAFNIQQKALSLNHHEGTSVLRLTYHHKSKLTKDIISYKIHIMIQNPEFTFHRMNVAQWVKQSTSDWMLGGSR